MSKSLSGSLDSDPLLGVRLRLLNESDLPMTLAWRNDERIRSWFLNSDKIEFAQHLAWYANYKKRDNDYVFIVETLGEESRPVGQVSLYQVDNERSSCEFGRLMIAPEEQGHGYATAATRAALETGFEKFALGLIYLHVISSNVVARSIYEKCGFIAMDENAGVLYMETRNPGVPRGE